MMLLMSMRPSLTKSPTALEERARMQYLHFQVYYSAGVAVPRRKG